MDTTLSLYFGNERTYISKVEPGQKGLELTDIGVIAETVKSDTDSMDALTRLESFLPQMADGAVSATIAVPVDNIFVHQFPALDTSDTKQLRRMLEFEIKNAYPQHSFDDFTSAVYPMCPRLDGTAMMVAIMMEKKYLMACEFILTMTGIPLKNIQASHFAANGALLYNYPDAHNSICLLIGMQENYCDVSVLKNGELAYYNLLVIPSPESFPEVCEKEIEKLLSGYVPFIDMCFCYGPALQSTILEAARAAVSVPMQRLNPFRMMTSRLQADEREFCAKAAHLFVPAIGASLPQPMIQAEVRLG